MRKGLQGKRNSIVKNSLKSLLLFVGLFVFGGSAVGQTDYFVVSGCPTTSTGINLGPSYLLNRVGNNGMNSYQTGQWTTYPSDINISDIFNNEAIITGYASGEVYDFVWTGANGTDYDFQLEFEGITPTDISISQANGPVFCSSTGVGPQIAITVDGAPGDSWSVVFEVTDIPSGTTSNEAATVTDSDNDGTETTIHTFSGITENTEYEVTAVYPVSGATCTYGGAMPGTLTFTFEEIPNAQTVTGSSVCSTEALDDVVLQSSEDGVTYHLVYDDGTNLPSNVQTWTSTGDGQSHPFGPETALGDYYVVADGCNGEVMMNGGPFYISPAPNDQAMSPTGIGCPGASFSAAGSESDVDYYLLRDGVRYGEVKTNTTGGFSFSLSDPGEYTVEAERNGCVITLSGSLEIEPTPTQYDLSANQNSYCVGTSPTGVEMDLSDSQSGVEYQLQRDDGSGFTSVGSSISGNGNPLSPASWTNLTEGTYQVIATSSALCPSTMNGTPDITETPLPEATISIDSNNDTWCEGEIVPNNVVEVDITSDSWPVSIVIEDNKGNSTTVNNINTSLYTFPKSDASTPAALQSPTSSTTYEVTSITNVVGCTGSGDGSTATINIVSNPSFTISGPDELCEDGSGTLSVAHLLAGPTYNYLWSNGETTSSINVSPTDPSFTTDYTLTVTNDNTTCKSSETHSITVNSLPVVSFTALNGSYCENGPIVSLSGSPSGGDFYLNGNSISSFDPADANVNLDATNEITYTFTDPDGCTNSTTQSFFVSEVNPVTINGLPSIICTDEGPRTFYGSEAGGSFTVTSNATGLDFTATPGSGQIEIVPGNSDAGVYQIQYTYTDGNNCTTSTTETFEIVNASTGALDIEMTDPSDNSDVTNYVFCPDDNTDYALEGLVSGLPVDDANGEVGDFSGPGVNNGTAGNGEATFNPQDAYNNYGLGDDHEIVFDFETAEGCEASMTITIQIGVVLETTPVINGQYCELEPTQTITGVPAGGEFEIEMPDGSTFNTLDDDFELNPSLWANNPGDYIITYQYEDDAILPDCPMEETWTATVGDTVGFSFELPQENFCRTDEGPYVFSINGYTPAPSDDVDYDGPGVLNDKFYPDDAGVGTHTLTAEITHNGCVSTATYEVTVNELPNIDFDLPSEICANSSDFTIEANNFDPSVTGATYSFSAYRTYPGGSTDPRVPIYETNPGDLDATAYIEEATVEFSPGYVSPGTFNITYKYDNTANGGCVNTLTKTIVVKEAPNVTFNVYDPVAETTYTGDISFCQNSGVKILKGSIFTEPGNPTNVGEGYFSGVPGIDNSAYEVSATDGYAEFDPSQVSAAADHEITYYYTHYNGCTVTRTKEFEIKEAPDAYTVISNPANGVFCEGGHVNIGLNSTETGVNYTLLRNGTENTSTNSAEYEMIGDGNQMYFDAEVEAEGTYTVRAELSAPPADVCTSMMNGSVEVRENKVTAIVDDVVGVTCNGGDDGEIHVTASSLSNSFIYTLTQDDGTGTFVEVATSTTGSFTAGTYTAGDYRVSITDGYGCDLATPATGYLEVTIDEPDPINISVVGTPVDVECFGGNSGSFVVGATGGKSGDYEFRLNGTTWLTNGTSQYTFTNLYAGSYDVQVRDADNSACIQTLSASVEIEEPDGPVTIASSSVTDVDCTTDGEIEIRGEQSGYSGVFNYVLYREASPGNWVQVNSDTQPDGTPVEFTITIGGDYRVDIFGENNCSTSGYYTVTAPTSKPVVNLVTITNESTPGAGDGSIEIAITGGVAPFTIDWTGTGVTDGVTLQQNLSAGTYSVRVTDANGCFDELLNLVVTDNDILGFTVDTKNPGPCFGNNNGEISLTATGGVLPYASITLINSAGDVITPSGSGDTYANYTRLVAGNYTATVVDGQPLSYSETIELTEPAELNLNFSKVSDATCYGNDDGEINFNATGGTISGDYTFTIIPESGSLLSYNAGDGVNVNVNNLSAGTYELQVRDDVGCYDNHFFEITEPEDLTINVEGVKHVKCNVTPASETGEITVSVDGRPGGTSYTYTWEESPDGTAWSAVDPATYDPNSNTISDLPGDAYYRVMAETTTCDSEYSGPIYINQPDDALVVDHVVTHVTTCHGDDSGSVRFSVSGGTAPYIINYGTVSDSWSGLNDYTVTGLSEGEYNFDIIDDNGCAFPTINETITEPDPFSVTDVNYGIECTGGSTGYVNFEVSGGLNDGGYSYHVRVVRQENNQVYVNDDVPVSSQPATIDETNIPGIDDLIEGTYTLQVYDANSSDATGCIYETTFALEELRYNVVETNPTCSAQENGSLDLTVTGGSGNYSYTWVATDGGVIPAGQVNEPDLTGLVPGDYELELTDDDEGCTVTETYTLEYENTLSVTTDVTDASCNGSTDGSITAYGGGGVETYEYYWEKYDGSDWQPLVNTQTASGLDAGYYMVTVRDANGCEVATESDVTNFPGDVLLVEEPADFNLSVDPSHISITDVSCNGGSDGAFTVTSLSYPATGPVVENSTVINFEYSIDGGTTWQSSRTFSGLSAGGYQVSMRDRGTQQPYCAKYDILDVVINEPTVLVVDLVEIVPVSCKDGSDGEIEISVPAGSGSGGNSYDWFRVTTSGNIGISPAGTDQRPTGLSAGDYRVRVTDVEGCQVWSDIYKVTEPATSPTITVENVTNVSTFGGSEGSIEISIDGGSGSYNIEWVDENDTNIPKDVIGTSTVINGLSASDYTVTVSDLPNGCEVSQTITITPIGAPLKLDTATVSPYPCYEAVNGEIQLIASGGQAPYTFTLTRQPGTEIPASSISGGFAYYNNLEPGYYNAQVVDDNGVVETVNDIHLTVPDPVVLTVTKDNDATCYGNSDGQITIQVTGGTPLPGDSDPLDTSVPDNDYYSYTINPENSPSISGFVENDGTGAYELINSSLQADDYEIVIADGNYCSNAATFTITQPNELTIAVADKKNVTCNGGNDGSLTVTIDGRPAGTSFTYDWEVDTNNDGTPDETYTTTTGTLTNIEAGVYTVNAYETLTLCPVEELTTEVNEPTAVDLTEISRTDVTTCHGDNSGSVRFSVTGGNAPYTIKYGTVEESWDGTSDYTATGLTAGDYDFEVFDVNGCSDDIQNVEITEPAALEVTDVESGILCQDLNSGWVTFDVAGGLYDVTNSEYAYRVRVVRHENNQEYFNDEESYDPAAPGNVLSVNIGNLIEGAYTLEVYDANSSNPSNCIFEQVFTLENVTIDATVTDPTCSGQDNGSIELSVTGGSGNYGYSWDNLETTKDIYDLAPGTYELTISQLDGSGVAQCSFTEQYELAYQNTLSVDASATDATCFNAADGSVTATATGGVAPYDYIWEKYNNTVTPPRWEPLANRQTIDPAGPGIYMVTVIDANGCEVATENDPTSTDVLTVGQPDEFSLTIDPGDVSNNFCNGDSEGSFRVTPILHPGTPGEIIDPAPGTTNFEYSIDGGATWQISPVFDGLAAGVYAVSMRDLDTDAPYCTKLDIENVTITQDDPLAIDLVNIEDVDCHGTTIATGSLIEVSALGGTAPYTYQWYRVEGLVNDILVGETSSSLADRPAGDYRVRVFDDNSCDIWSDVYTIFEPATSPEITIESEVHPSAPLADDGSITISISGGVSPYSIVWTDGTNTWNDVTTISGLVQDSYTVTVEDANGCVVDETITLTDPGSALNLTIEEQTPPGPCYGAGNGVIELRATGGNSDNYTFTLVRQPSTTISDPVISGNIARYENLQSGFYTARVEDANGVEVDHSDIDLTGPDPLVLTINEVRDAECEGATNGYISFDISGGDISLGDYAYSIVPQSGSIITGTTNGPGSNNTLSAGDYSLQVTDGTGVCTVSESFTLGEPAPIVIEGAVSQISCNGAGDGEIFFNISGGHGPYTAYSYEWFEWVDAGADLNDPSDDTWASYDVVNDGSTSIDGLAPGSYYVVATEVAPTGCSQQSEAFVIQEPDPITVTATPQDITTCNGDNTGSIEVNITGGTPPYIVDYGAGTVNGGGPIFTINDLTANTYTITVYDDHNCEAAAVTATINEPAAPLSVENLTSDIACDGSVAGNETSGTVSFDISGGVSDGAGDFSYHVRLLNTTTSVIQTQTVDGTSTVSFNGLIAGDYQIRVRDNNADASTGCDNPIFETFTLEHIGISGTEVNATCSGIQDGEIINVEVTGASSSYTFDWSTTDGFGIDDSSLDQSGLAPGTYTLEIDDTNPGGRGCTISKEFIVENDNVLNITASVKDISCAGGADGAIRNVQVTGISDISSPVQYVWQGPGIGTFTQMSDEFGFDPNLYDLEPGSYTLTVTDGNSCDVTKVFIIDEPSPITYDLTTSLDNCSPYSRSISIGDLDNTDGTGDPANFTYVWNGPGSFSIATDDQSISGINKGGTYTVQVIDEAGCSQEESLTVFGELSVDADLTNVRCFNGADGSIVLTIAGGSGDYSYEWEDASGNPTADPTVKNQNGLTAGTYTVIIYDNHTAQDCGGGTTTPYSVEEKFTITQPADIVIDYEKIDVSCNGNADGQITLDVTGGSGTYEYAWTPVSAPGIVQGLRKQVGLEGGIYGVTVTDALTRCEQNTTIEIIEPAVLDFDVDFTDTQCNGTNSITLDETSATGGFGPYEFSATGPGVPSGWTESDDFVDVQGGEYNFTLTDLGSPGNCSVTKTVVLTKPISITPVVTAETCPDSNNGAIELEVEGGRSPFTFSWIDENGDPTVSPNNKNQAGLSGGQYTVTYSDDRTCGGNLPIDVPITNNIELNPSITPIVCYGEETGAISITPTGGSGNYSFKWFGPDGFTSTDSIIENLAGGTYEVEVVDLELQHYGTTCTFVESFVVSQPTSPIEVTDVVITDVKCHGDATGDIVATVAGGMGSYTYAWSGPGDLSGQTSNQLTGVGAGDYNLTVTDAVTGCVANFGPYTIHQPAQPLNIEVDEVLHVTVPSGSNGAIQVNVTGGTGNYGYTWESVAGDGSTTEIGDNSNRQEGLSAGTYKITVADANNCEDDVTVVVSEPGSALSISETHKDVRPCFGNNNGEIRIQVSGGTPDMTSGSATYHIVVNRGADNIYNGDDDFIELENLIPGSYHIEVTDANGITETIDVTIAEPPVINISVDDINPVACVGGNDGAIEVTVSGGTPLDNAGTDEYQLELIGPAGTSGKVTTTGNHTFNTLVAGNYTLRVWDDSNEDGSYSNGTAEDDCYQTISMTVPEPNVVASIEVVPGYETLCQGESPELLLTIANWDFSSQPDLDITLNDGTTETVDQTPYQFTPATAPTAGVVGYEVSSVVETGGTCSKGQGDGVATVTVHETPTATIYGDGRLCPGESRNIGVSLTGAAPWTIVYTDGTNNYTESGITSSTKVIEVSPLETTTYELVSVTDSHCTGTFSGDAKITVDPTTTVELIAPATPEICRGKDSYVDIDFDPATSGPWEVTYQEDNGTDVVERTISVENTELETGESFFRLDISPLVTTEYSLVSVTDTYSGVNSCPATLTGLPVTITVNEVPEAAGEISGPAEVCQVDTATYSVPVIADADSYTWTVDPSIGTIISGAGTREIQVEFDASSVSGYIAVQGTNGCGDGPLNRLYVNVRPAPTVGAITGPSTLCQSAKGVRYSVPPEDEVSGFQWTVPEGLTIVSGQGSASIIVDVDDATTATAGQITATPFNSCGLSTNMATIDVTVNANPDADAGSDRMICGADELATSGLNGNTLGGTETGEWSIVSGFANIDNVNAPNTTLTNISSGDLVLEWKVTDTGTQCYSTDQVVIRNNKLNVEADVDKSLTCDGSTDIYGTVLPDNTTGNWSIEPGDGSGIFEDATEAGTTVYDLAPGENTLRWTITQNGCESFAEVVVVNDQAHQAEIDGDEIRQLCGDDISLTANDPALGTDQTGKWTVIKGRADFDDATSHNVSVTNLSMGENILRWTITKNGNCTTFDEITIYNNQLEVDAGDGFTTCSNSVVLNGTVPPSGATGQWTAVGAADGNAIFADGNAWNTQVDNLVNGNNTFRWTISLNGCDTPDEVTIESYAATPADVGTTQTICGTSTTLTGNQEESYESGRWTIVKGSGDFDDPALHDTDVTGVGYGENIYRWTIKNGNCSSSAELTVINNQVEAFAGKDTVTCEQTINLAATPAPAGYVGHWSVEPGQGSVTWEDPNTQSNARVKLGYGTNQLGWTVEHIGSGCTSSDLVTIQVNAIEVVEAGGDQTLEGGDGSTNLEATKAPEGGDGYWTIISGGGNIDDPTSPTTEVTELEMGPNVFMWTVTLGDCSRSDQVTITNGDVIQAETIPDFITCVADVQLGANDPGNAIGRWTRGSYGSGEIVDDDNPNTMVRNLGPGDNEFVWTISYGPGTTSTSDVIVVTNNKPDEARPKDGGVTCDDSFLLEGNEPDPGMGTVSWSIVSGGGDIVDPTAVTTEVTNLMQGENRFVYSIKKGVEKVCYSTDTITVINGTPTTPYAGDDKTLCTDSVLLEPNVPNHGTGEWRILEGGAEFDGNMARRISPGVNRFKWVVSTEYCTLEDVVTITNNQPSVANAGDDRPVCENTVVLSGSLPTRHTGEWSRISGSGEIQNPTEPDAEVINLGQGENKFRWTITNGQCSDWDDVIIRNDFKEAKILYLNPEPICVDTVALRANNPSPGVGTWGVIGGSGSASFDDPSNPNTTVRDLAQGENILTWTVTNGHCTDVATVTIVNNMPTDADAGGNFASCENSVTLSANTPVVGNGTWTVRNGSGDFVDANNPNTQVNGLNFGANVFRWTIVNEGCSSFDDVQVDYNTIEPEVGDDRTVCSDTEVLQAANPSPGTGTWTVAGGTSQATFDNINDPGTTVRNLRKGVNRLKWTVSYKGCQTTKEVSITNASPSTAYAGNTQRKCADETVLDALQPEIGTGRWEVISGSATISDADINNPKASVTNIAKGENVFRWIVENDICRSEDDVLIVNNQPSTPFAGSDLTVCEPNHDLMAATPEYGEGFWSIVEGGGNISDVTDPRAKINNLAQGRNVLKWTVSQGQCTLSDEIVITNNTATAANAGPDVADCKDWSQLDANPPLQGVGEWYIVSGNGVFDNTADESTVIRDLGFGENILMWEIWNGSGENRCFSRDTVVIFNKVPEQSDAGNDKEFCDNYTTLNANLPPEGAVGTWTVVSGAGDFESPNSNNSIVRNIGFGNNVYKWTISYDDCVTESTVTIKSNKTDAYAGEDVVVYEPEAMLNANNVGDLNARWNIVGGTGEFEDPAFFNTMVTGLSEGINTYRWVIDVEGCTSYDDVSVEYRPVPDAGFITDVDEGCWPLDVLFTNYSVGVQNRNYHWDFGDGNSSGDQNPRHTYEEAGNYPVTLTVPGPDGIEGRYQKIIRVHDHPEAAFSVMPEEVYVPGDEVRFFDLSVDAVNYLWDFGDGNSSTEAHPVHEYTESGIFDVMLHVTNEFGCVDSTVIEGAVTAISKGFIKFPNAFRPRPDGGSSHQSSETNILFRPVYRDVDSYQIQIYNRWGQLIYESTDIDEGWNGLYKGQLAPQAVYVWRVSGTFVNGEEFRETGSVLLVR